ncbi:hypothetical protein BGZ91_000598 [Linnemannia elongata]|nr:hypothetical protein BGZ91_000598 [Linnemannia elongata]
MAAYTPNNNNININDTPVQLAEPILIDEHDSVNRKIGRLRDAHLVALPSNFGESILKSQFKRLSKVIPHLVFARFAAIDTLALLTFDPASQEASRLSAGQHGLGAAPK